MRQALRDAGLAAFVALVLAIPLVGFKAVDTGGPLGLDMRFDWVAVGVAIVFVGRLALGVYRDKPLVATALVGSAGAFLALGLAPYEDLPEAAMRTAGGFLAGVLLAVVAAIARPAATRIGAAVERFNLALQKRFPNPVRTKPTFGRFVFYGVMAAAFILPLSDWADRRSIDLATQVLIYVMLGWGLNVVVGLAGLLDLGYVAFYAVGAYSYALLARELGLSFWACLPLAGLFAAMFGVLLGFPVLRLRGDYLAIVTLGFGEMIRLVLINWQSFTGGPNGLTSIPRPSFFGFPFTSDPEEGETAFHQLFGLEYASIHRLIFAYYLILALALLTHALTERLRRLPIGRAWEALREDEIACRALGINPTNTKLSAFAIGAMFGGFAGSFFATRQGFISPESFTFGESATILAIVVLGGMGSQTGVVIAAAILVLLPEFARDFAHYRMLLFGAAMVAIMVWRPRGLITRREPSLRLEQ